MILPRKRHLKNGLGSSLLIKYMSILYVYFFSGLKSWWQSGINHQNVYNILNYNFIIILALHLWFIKKNQKLTYAWTYTNEFKKTCRCGAMCRCVGPEWECGCEGRIRFQRCSHIQKYFNVKRVRFELPLRGR